MSEPVKVFTHDEIHDMLADLRAKLEQAEASNEEWERKCRDLCLAHGPLLIEHHDVKAERDAALARVKEVERERDKAHMSVEHWKGLALGTNQEVVTALAALPLVEGEIHVAESMVLGNNPEISCDMTNAAEAQAYANLLTLRQRMGR